MIYIVDAVTSAVTFLGNDWTSGNTDDIVPTIQAIELSRQIDCANNDFILIYLTDAPMQVFGMGADTFDRNNIVSIDIRTTYKRAAVADIRAHAVKMKDEVLRIVEANVLDVDSDFILMLPIRVRDRSDKSMGLGRWIIDISMRDWS